MQTKTSRNQREGVYIGVVLGRHQRLYLCAPLRSLVADDSHLCDECDDGGWSVRQYRTSTGWGDHPEYGQYRWWEGEAICTSCGHKTGWGDSSI